MAKLRHQTLKDKKIYQVLFVTLVMVFVGIVVMSYLYYGKVQRTIRDESCEYIGEISKQMDANVGKIINDNFAMLNAITVSLQGADVTYEQLHDQIGGQKAIWKYESLMFVDSNGKAIDEFGATMFTLSPSFLKRVVADKLDTMSTSETIKGKEYVLFAIPVTNIRVGGSNMVAVVVSFEISKFDNLLEVTAFGGKGYAHIVRADGTVAIRSSSINALATGYNIITSLEKEATIISGRTISQVKEDILAGKSGLTEFSIDSLGAREYMNYISLGTQGWMLLTFVPVAAVNVNSNMLLMLTLLMCGVVALVFGVLFAALMSNFYRNNQKLENIAYVDPVTKGDTIQLFYKLTDKFLKTAKSDEYVLVYTNIEKFKVLNEQFGQKKCDQLLTSISYSISCNLTAEECVGRLYADKFCILLKYEGEDALLDRFLAWRSGCKEHMRDNGFIWLNFTMEFGIYVITDTALPILQMVDRAKLALSAMSNEGRYDFKYATYAENTRQALLREKQLEDMMVSALNNEEFQVYLQPKYHTQTETIGGAEALVRWVSKSEGMIYPDAFIPLFEKNGFIVQVDLAVFEIVCRTIRKWVEEGREPYKISVNCSRVHLKSVDFLDKYCEIADRYKIDRKYLELELTENTVFENVQQLSRIITQIHDAGFGCSMDDFGSGYSSLNLIKDIPVDILKLDKVFFSSNEADLARTESVVGGIINMAKALNMQSVAEGVEERFQVDMLKKLNCDFIQGYFFAKPMSIIQFEKLAYLGGK